MVESDLAAELDFAHELAGLGSTITMARFGERIDVEAKDDLTPVTEVDRAVERAIRDALGRRFPRDGVLGEEYGTTPGSGGRRWIVDPIDGTKLFVEGIPLWTTLIALEVDGRIVLGVADAPALGDRYVGVAGSGAWRGSRRLRVSRATCLEEAFVAHSGLDEWVRGARGDALAEVAARSRKSRGLSDAWGQLLVAQGSVDALLEHDACQPWDWAATRVIVEEAGGRMSTLGGAPPIPGGDLLVSNGEVHDEIVTVLGSSGRRLVSDGGKR